MKHSTRINRALVAKKCFNFSFKSRWLLLPLMLFTLSVGNAWGTATLTGNVVYSCSPTSIANSTTHQYWGSKAVARNNSTDLTASANWEMNVGSNAGLGANNNQKAKMILSNGSMTGGSAIATAIGKETSSTYVAAFVCNTALSNVGKFAFSHDGYNNNAPANMWLCYSTDNWSTATAIALTVGNSGNVTFNATIPSAKYAFVIYKSSYTRVANPTFTFYEGTTGGGCSNPTTALSANAASTTIYAGVKSQLSVSGGNGSSVTYSVTSANSGYANIDGDNKFSATRPGTYTVRASQDADNGVCGGTDDITITVRYQVKWSVNGDDTYNAGSPTPYIEEHNGKIGTFPTSPAKSACDNSKDFVGWTATPIDGSTNTEPTFVTPQTPITDNITLYAVFATRTPNSYSPGDINDLINGKNVIIYNANQNKAMASSIQATGKLNGLAVTFNSTNISSPDAALIWTVYNSGTKYIFKNSNNNYLRVTSNSANTKLTCDGTSDTWTISEVSTGVYSLYSTAGSSTYPLEAYYSSPNYFFTSYKGSGNNYNMKFYVPTYSAYVTTCCTSLGTINGPVSLSQLATPDPTKLKATWTMNAPTGIDSYTLEVYDSNNTLKKTINNYTSGSEITGLTPCTSYYVKLYTVSQGAPYCDGGLIGTSSAVETGNYSVDYSGCSGVSQSGAETACASEALSVTFSVASAAYVLPDAVSVTIGGNVAKAGTDYTWTKATGVLSIPAAKQTGNIVIDVDGVLVGCAADPTVTNEVLGLNGSGTFSLSQVDVSTSGWSTGSNTCEWADYGFVWGTSANPTVGGSGCETEQVGTSGNATSWNGSLTGDFEAGTTYHYRAYAKNSKASAAYVYSTTEGTFTPYTVSYNANGGSGEVATVVVNAGGSVTLPDASAFSLDCNDLTKWALNSASGTQYNPEGTYSSINANAEFYAVWSTRTYTVQYAAGSTPANGGAITGSHANDTKTCGVALSLPGVTFYSTGYTQDGWAKADGGNKTNNLSGSYSSNQEQTFYPHWLINTYNVTKGTKTGCSGNDFTVAATVDHYGSITVTASPDNAHKGSAQVSVSPKGNASVNGTTISNIIGDIEVSVSFAAKETATVILHDATGEHTQDGTRYEEDNYTLPPTAADCTESEFYGWYTEPYVDQATAPTGTKYIAKNMSKALAAGDNHFYAVYATVEDRYTNNYTKIIDVNDLTTGDYLISSGSYCMGNAIQSTNRMAETSLSATNNVKSNPAASLIWTITKSGTKVTLYNDNVSKYLAVSGGVIAVQDNAHNFTFDYGTTKADSWTFTSESSPTYQLSYSQITGNSYSYFVMNTSQSSQIDLYKRDKAPSAGAPYTTSPSCTTHDLTSVVDPSSPAGGTVELGKTTVLETKTTTAKATPSDHYTFSHWTISGAGASLENADGEGKSTDNPVEVTMGTADATITAHFTEKPKCTVEFYNNGGSAISSNTYWLGETPTAPTLVDGHDHDACDETSTTHYGWTRTALASTVATQADIDELEGDATVYTKAAGVPAIVAGDNGKTLKYHAVWAQETTTKTAGKVIDYDGSGKSTLEAIEGVTASGLGGDYADSHSPNILKFDNTGDYIQFDLDYAPTSLSFTYKKIAGGGASSMTIQECATSDGDYSNVETLALSGVQNATGTKTTSQSFSQKYIRMYFNKADNVGVGTIVIQGYTGNTTYSAFLTNCCNQLEDINGEVEFTDPTTAVVTWDKLDNVAASNAYAVSYRTGEAAYGTTNVGAVDLTGSKATCTITGLSCNTSYDIKIAVTAATGYCDKEQVIEGQNSGKYTITSADGGNPTGGTFATLESACNGDNVGLLAEAATGYNFAGWTITKASSGTVSPAADEESTSFTMPAENVTVSAAFNAISYTITYENMDGATNHVSNPSSYTVEDAISLGDPTKEGFNFGGWFINSDLAAGHEAGSPAIAAGSTGTKIFYAKWIADDKWSVAITAPSHGTITVSWNGGVSSFSEGAQNIGKNTDITITATPSDGYQLTSLKIGDADFTSGSVHKLIASIVISATFTPITYTITYNNMDGATNHKDNVASYTIEETEDVLLQEASKTGYDFGGWFTDNGTWENEVMWIEKGSTGNVVVYAKWTAKESTIAWNAHGGSVSPTSSKYTYDGSTVELPTPTREHYTFDGWFTAAEGGEKITEIGTENKPVTDVTYHAHWTEITYTVTWSVNGDDAYAEGDPENPTTSVTYNTKVTKLPTAPTSAECDDAKKFVGWRAEKITGTSATKPESILTKLADFSNITGDITYYAVFADVTGGASVTLDFPDDNSDHNSVQTYTDTWIATSGTYSWSIENFNNNKWDWSFIKCGRKSYASIGTITTSDAIGFPVDTVIINIGGITASNVNSAELYISSASNFETKTSMDIEQSTGVKKLVIASPAKDMFYQIKYDCASASSNGIVQINSITYKQKLDTANYVTTCPNCTDIPTFDVAPTVSEISCTGATVTATNGLETLGEGEGCNIREYGFVWGTTETPTVASNTGKRTVSENIAEGTAWSHSITDLDPGTHYYVRAYAENKIGVAYSAAQSFWTNGVSSIAVTTAPTKTNYIVGEAFDATGMVVTATMADGSEVDVTGNVTYSTSAFNAAGNVNFPINYSLCETNVQTTQPVNVYSVTVNEGTNADKGVMDYDAAGTITISSLAEHTTVEFVKTNADLRDNGDGTFSIINPTGNVTVTVNYIAAVQVAVKFFANGTELTGLALSPYQSESFDMPDADAVASAMTTASVSVSNDVHFVGWSATPFPRQTSEPTMIGETGKVTDDANYYAVFSNVNTKQITGDDFAGNYANNEGEKEIDDVTYQIHDICKQSGIQFKSTPGYLYSKTALPYITKIEITTNVALVVNACSNNSGTVDGNAIAAEGTSPRVYTFPAGKQYFKVTGAGGTDKASLIKIYYAQGTGYYTTQFSTLTFKKADGTTDKTIQKATNDSYTLTNADVPSENDTPEDYTFLNKWSDGTDTYAKDAVVTLSSDITLKPCWDIEVNDNATVPAANIEASDITVNEGKTLTLMLTEDTKLGDIFVENGGTLTISGEKTVNAKDFYIEAQEGYSGQVKGNGTIAVYGQAYYDLTLNPSGTMDNSKWYAFAVPFPVDAATGIQRLSNDGKTANAGFNSHYVLLKYDSEERAASGKGNSWKYITKGETLMPGNFYMIALNSNVYNRVRMTKKAGENLNNKADLTLKTYSAANDLNANWNALANNALAYANVDAEGGNAGLKVQTYRNSTVPDGYDLFDFNEITLTVGTPFFVQAAEQGTMSVTIAASNNTTVKAPAHEVMATEEFQLRLGADTESYYDKLFVSANEDAKNEYQIGHDLAKMGVSSTVPQMYVPAYDTKLCDAEFPLVNNQASFPLTFVAPQAGTYQLYVAREARDAELYLTYEGGIIWNLSMGAYELELTKGTTEGYGLLLQAKAPGAATGVDNIDASEAAQKVIINDHVYILRNGQMYDVNGKVVK